MTKNSDTYSENNPQEKILALLQHDPESAVTLMIAQYTGLIWAAAGQYLSNPEDIKECVNDTFTEFYCHQERFDSTKGSLPLFLTVIAKNKAISRYRKNKSRETLPLPDEIDGHSDDIRGAELKFDLEQALSSLKPEDAEIIRMKYYNGMTLQEIARSLDLPYETVKKRQQRSLGKMRLFLTTCLIVLLLALLTACAYLVLRYFGIVPGYGINTDPDQKVYILQEECSLTTEYGECVLLDAMAMGDTFWLYGTYYCDSESSMERLTSLLFNEPGETPQLKLEYDGTVYKNNSSWAIDENSINFDLKFSEGTIPEVFSSGTDETVELTFMGPDAEITFVMKQIADNNLTEYQYIFGEKGGLMALPYQEEDRLFVELYPLNTGEASIVPILIYDSHMQGKTGDITLTSAEGTTITGERYYEPISSQYFSKWDFGAVPPGDYMLHVPYVYITQPMEQTAVSIDLTTCTWEEKIYPIWDSTLSVISCEKIVELDQIPEERGIPLFEDCSYWLIEVQYQKADEMNPELAILPLDLYCPYLEGDELSFSYPNIRGCSLQSISEDGRYEYLIYIQGNAFDLTQFQLVTPEEVNLRWIQSFDFPIHVDPK